MLVQQLTKQMDVRNISLAIHVVGAVFFLIHTSFATAWSGQAPVSSSIWWSWAVAIFSGAISTGIGNLL